MASQSKHPLRFDRGEWAGAFGDLGTDVPLIVLLILRCQLDAGRVLVVFGACQVLTGLAYRLPMPVQPLKAMAAIAIADGLSGQVLAGGGLAVGLAMLALTLTGALELLARIIPKSVVRGLQVGLGIKLAMLALGRYVSDGGLEGYLLGAAALLLIVLLRENRRCPAALPLLALGLLYVVAVQGIAIPLRPSPDLSVPALCVPSWEDILLGLVLLAIPQLPLSLGNSVLATRQTIQDLFPDRPVGIRRIGLSYSLLNLAAPLLGGVPVCHGSGGLAGHYAFGARTGGSTVIYGATFLVCGLLFGHSFFLLIAAFPKSILGVMLLFEAIALMQLARDMAADARDFAVVLTVGLLAAGLPYGFCVALVVGPLVHYWMLRTAVSPAADPSVGEPTAETRQPMPDTVPSRPRAALEPPAVCPELLHRKGLARD